MKSDGNHLLCFLLWQLNDSERARLQIGLLLSLPAEHFWWMCKLFVWSIQGEMSLLVKFGGHIKYVHYGMFWNYMNHHLFGIGQNYTAGVNLIF